MIKIGTAASINTFEITKNYFFAAETHKRVPIATKAVSCTRTLDSSSNNAVGRIIAFHVLYVNEVVPVDVSAERQCSPVARTKSRRRLEQAEP